MKSHVQASILAAVASVGLWLGQDSSKPRAGLEVGQQLPEFRLNDSTGRARRVAPPGPDQPAGRWTVVAFYPKAATPG